MFITLRTRLQPALAAALLTLLLTACGGGGSQGDAGGTGGPQLTQGRTSDEFVLSGTTHPLGTALVTRILLPDGSDPRATGSRYPVAFAYHGSGGLFREPAHAGDPCLTTLEPAYQEISDWLLAQGVAVVWVDSFFSRDQRFCEDNTDAFRDFAPAVMDNNLQQTLVRLHDTLHAEKELCRLARLDCSHMMRIGTSEGATAALLPTHRALDSAVAALYDPGNPGNALDRLPLLAEAALPTARPEPRFVMAISPGCGFYGAIPLSTSGPLQQMFYPQQPVYLELGANDTVPAECSTALGQGRRQLQAEAVKAGESISDADYRYHTTLYPDAGHLLWQSHQEQIKAKLLPLVQSELLAAP